MSLKFFHIFFIALAIICTFGFAAWTAWAQVDGLGTRISGICSGVLGVPLTIYGYWFVTKKAKQLIV